MTLLATSLRTVLRRVGADWPVLLTAMVTVAIGMVQLASVPIFTDAVSAGALDRILADAPVDGASLDVIVFTDPENYDSTDRLVSDSVDRATGTTGAAVSRRLRSSSFALPSDRTGGDEVDLVVMEALEGIERHATIVAGSWPAAASGEEKVPVALRDTLADRLGLEIGAVVEISSRRGDASIVTEVVGHYRLDDHLDRFWGGDELLLEGIVDGQSFRTFGPMVVTSEAILEAPAGRLLANWHVEPDLDRLTVGDLDDLRRPLTDLADELNAAVAATPGGRSGAVSSVKVETGMPALLAEADRSLTVSRSGIFGVVLQLAVLSGLALVITGGLLVDTRRRETDLLKARGAGRPQLMALTIVEAGLLVVPPALVAPSAARLIVEVLGAVGPLASIELDIEPATGRSAYITVALVAVAMTVLLSWPALKAARPGVVSPLTGHRRQRRHALISRSGVDLALVVLMVLAFWQLRELGSQRTGFVGDRLAIDPVLIVAPALALLTGAAVTLRLIPVMARIAERRVARGTSPTIALAGWQVARRPSGYGRPAFLLVMAFGIGVFASTYAATWTRSQSDQAAYQIGADALIAPNRRTGDSITDFHLVAAHESLPGISTSMPLIRRIGSLPGADGNGRFLALDAARAGRVVQIRDDLADDLPALLATLVEARPDVPSIDLPGEPEWISMTVVVDEEQVERFGGQILPREYAARVLLVLRDGNDMMHRVELGEIEAHDPWVDETGAWYVEEQKPLVAELTSRASDGSVSRPTYPLSIVDIEIRSQVPSPPSRQVDLLLGPLTIGSGEGTGTIVPLDDGTVRWATQTRVSGGLGVRQSVTVGRPSADGGVSLQITTGFSSQSSVASIGLRPGPTMLPVTVPVVVSRSWLESTRSEIGDSVFVPTLLSGGAELEVVGTVERFPTVEHTVDHAVVVDLPTLQIMSHELDRPIAGVEEHWIDFEVGADADEVAATLAGEPFDSVQVESQEQRRGTLTSDPAALATIAAFTVGYVAAAIFAVIVFAVAVVMSVRERRSEITLLRSLGLSPRQLSGWMTAEQITLLALTLVLGTVIGLALSAIALPLISLGPQGAAVLPTAVPVYPWATLLTVVLTPAAVLTVIVSILIARLRRRPLASMLRLGDD